MISFDIETKMIGLKSTGISYDQHFADDDLRWNVINHINNIISFFLIFMVGITPAFKEKV